MFAVRELASVRERLSSDCSHFSGKMDTHWKHGGSMKDAGMRIRVEQELRDAFVAVCQTQHVPAAQVLRQFMRGYVQQALTKTPSANTSIKTKRLRGNDA